MSTAMGTQKWMSVKIEASCEGDFSIFFAKARGVSAGAMLGQKRGLANGDTVRSGAQPED